MQHVVELLRHWLDRAHSSGVVLLEEEVAGVEIINTLGVVVLAPGGEAEGDVESQEGLLLQGGSGECAFVIHPLLIDIEWSKEASEDLSIVRDGWGIWPFGFNKSPANLLESTDYSNCENFYVLRVFKIETLTQILEIF